MEGTKCQLRTRLTDRLCRHYPNGIPLLGCISSCEVLTIAIYTYSPLAFASQYRTDLDHFDARIFDSFANFLVYKFPRRNDQLVCRRVIHIMQGSTPQNSVI